MYCTNYFFTQNLDFNCSWVIGTQKRATSFPPRHISWSNYSRTLPAPPQILPDLVHSRSRPGVLWQSISRFLVEASLIRLELAGRVSQFARSGQGGLRYWRRNLWDWWWACWLKLVQIASEKIPRARMVASWRTCLKIHQQASKYSDMPVKQLLPSFSD